MNTVNSEEIDTWVWEHAQIQGHLVVSIKNDDGENIIWKDTVTGETIDVVYSDAL